MIPWYNYYKQMRPLWRQFAASFKSINIAAAEILLTFAVFLKMNNIPPVHLFSRPMFRAFINMPRLFPIEMKSHCQGCIFADQSKPFFHPQTFINCNGKLQKLCSFLTSRLICSVHKELKPDLRSSCKWVACVLYPARWEQEITWSYRQICLHNSVI